MHTITRAHTWVVSHVLTRSPSDICPHPCAHEHTGSHTYALYTRSRSRAHVCTVCLLAHVCVQCSHLCECLHARLLPCTGLLTPAAAAHGTHAGHAPPLCGPAFQRRPAVGARPRGSPALDSRGLGAGTGVALPWALGAGVTPSLQQGSGRGEVRVGAWGPGLQLPASIGSKAGGSGSRTGTEGPSGRDPGLPGKWPPSCSRPGGSTSTSGEV